MSWQGSLHRPQSVSCRNPQWLGHNSRSRHSGQTELHMGISRLVSAPQRLALCTCKAALAHTSCRTISDGVSLNKCVIRIRTSSKHHDVVFSSGEEFSGCTLAIDNETYLGCISTRVPLGQCQLLRPPSPTLGLLRPHAMHLSRPSFPCQFQRQRTFHVRLSMSWMAAIEIWVLACSRIHRIENDALQVSTANLGPQTLSCTLADKL